MIPKNFLVLSRVLCRDAYFQPCLFRRRVFMKKSHGDMVSRYLCTEKMLKDIPQLDQDLPGTLPENFLEKRVCKAKDYRLNIQDVTDLYPVLQKLVDLGVEIYKFNRDQSLCKYLLTRDFDKHIKPYIIFLHNNGVPEDKLSEFLTSNPYIIQADFDDLSVRINYLESKKFTKEMIADIITKYPKWLIQNVRDVDSRLGELQEALSLSGDQVRSMVTTYPGIISVRRDYLRLNIFTFKEEFGITLEECQNLLLKEPRLLKISNSDLIQTSHYILYNMTLPVSLILQQPQILKFRVHKLRERHLFLQRLGRAQYNPKLAGYVSFTDLMANTDEEFATKIARSSLSLYYKFLKTL